MTQLALMIDLERCTGCKSCEAACKQVNRLGPHEYRNRVMWLNDPVVPALDFLTVTCQQCARPACVRACPVHPKALFKHPETGVVSVDEDRCTGCGECVLACPYGAMGYDPVDHHAVKCDLCAPRRAVGEGPACASVCPTRAIRFGARTDLLAVAEKGNRAVRDHDQFLQGPATVYLDRLARGDSADSGPVDRLSGRSVPRLLTDHGPREALTPDSAVAPYRTHPVADEAPRVVPGGCNICFNACTVKYHVRDDRVVNVLGNEEDPVFQGRICPKSQMTLQLYNNPLRLTQPLKRVGERGSGQFQPIGWAQAMDEIAARMSAVRDQHGSEALAIHAGTRTGVLNILGFMPMFARLWGTPNTATTEPFCDAGKVVALQLTQGSTNLGNIYTGDDIGSAAMYVYFGDNQAETRPVNFGMVNDWRVNNGARMIVVDPRLTATASKADLWLPIRPGTDMALALGLIHHLFAAGLHDRDFCQAWLLGWEQWRDYVHAKGYSADWAAGVTGLDPDRIRELAEEIARADGCMLFASRGVNQHTNSAQTNRVLMFLAAITGNWGRKGGGFFNVAAEPDWKPVPIPPERLPSGIRPAVSKNPAGWLPAMLKDRPYPIRALITGNNPLAQWPGQTGVRRALAGLDLLVHVELFQNETSAMADYVLPATTGAEKGGISRLAEDRRIVWNDALISGPGEARSDHWIWIELGKRFGFDDVLKDDYKNPAVFWDQVFRHATPDLRGVTLERLRNTPYRWVRTPVAAADDPEPGSLYLPGMTAFGQPQGKRFPTPSGKLEFWTEALEQKFAAAGLSALPEFYSEPEQLLDMPYLQSQPDGPEGKPLSPFFGSPVGLQTVAVMEPSLDSPGRKLRELGFDMELVTGRPPAPHFHSWTHYFWQAQEMWPELYCQMHPDKARQIGVKDGDRVRVETPGAAIEARAWVTPGIRPTAVFIPIGWDTRQPFNPAETVNLLTGRQYDPVSEQANLKSHLCRVMPV